MGSSLLLWGRMERFWSQKHFSSLTEKNVRAMYPAPLALATTTLTSITPGGLQSTCTKGTALLLCPLGDNRDMTFSHAELRRCLLRTVGSDLPADMRRSLSRVRGRSQNGSGTWQRAHSAGRLHTGGTRLSPRAALPSMRLLHSSATGQHSEAPPTTLAPQNRLCSPMIMPIAQQGGAAHRTDTGGPYALPAAQFVGPNTTGD